MADINSLTMIAKRDLGPTYFDEPSWHRALRAVEVGLRHGIDPATVAKLGTVAIRRDATVSWAKEIYEMVSDIHLAYPMVSAELALKIIEVAFKVGTHPYWLANVIAFESGFKTDKPNPISGAVGLIQFMPKVAAKLFGMVPEITIRGRGQIYSESQKAEASSRVAAMSAFEQLDLVKKYLDPFVGRLIDQSAIYMSVFYPAAMLWPPTREFPGNVAEMNPGISTPGDYVRMAVKRAKLPHSLRLPVLT